MLARVLFGLMFALCLSAAEVGAQGTPDAPEGEGMMVKVPLGWKLVHQNILPKQEEYYYSPAEPSATGITDFLLYSEFRGMEQIDAEGALANTIANTKTICPELEVGPVQKGRINNYSAAFVILVCPKENQQNQGRVSVILTIIGSESVYQVQKIWTTPTFSQGQSPILNTTVQGWVNFIRSLTVCDTRDAAHPCGAIDPTNPSALAPQ